MPKRIVIIAGEESGDIHAAAFVRQLKQNNPNLQVSGMGGQHMQAAGVDLISDIARFGITGLSEVLLHARVIHQAFKQIKAHLSENKPDLLVLVDYPGFNLRLAKFAKHTLGIRTLYYISPQIWAWKAGRIKTIKNCIDHMAVILPFEKKIYEQAGVPVSFVGHPLIEKINMCENPRELRGTLGFPPDKRLIALLPGSRGHEIRQHMPILEKTATLLYKQFPNLHFVIPVAGTIDPQEIQSYFTNKTVPFSLIQNQAAKAVSCCDCAIVASGTASLEVALLEKPMCIIYKSSLLTYVATFKLIKVKYLGLCNLLQNKMIVPELLQYDCNPKELARIMVDFLTDQSLLLRMQTRLRELKLSLSEEQADCSISQLIESQIA